MVYPEREEVYLAHPQHSLRAERTPRGDAWKIDELRRLPREQSYRQISSEIEEREPVTGSISALSGLAFPFMCAVNPLSMKVTKLEQVSEDGRPCVRVELEDCPPGHPLYRSAKVRLLRRRLFAVDG